MPLFPACLLLVAATSGMIVSPIRMATLAAPTVAAPWCTACDRDPMLVLRGGSDATDPPHSATERLESAAPPSPHCSIIFVRHGQSEWNLSGRFTGWTDINLTDVGREQAAEGGREMKRHGLVVDIAYTSELVRAQETMSIVLHHAQQEHVPVITDWRINERHYGALQGRSKQETVDEYGLEQVKLWRNSFSDPPPPASTDSDQNPINDPKYQDVPRYLLPNGECLKDTLKR